ncbi:MAG: hypothetical protein IJX79_02755 [Clostridia bacterium]|nr:hypothetical protein [Clostridia bacterium]
MNKQGSAMSFVKGMGAGMAAGMMAYAAAKIMMSSGNHNLSKGSSKIVHAVGDLVDGVQTMFK